MENEENLTQDRFLLLLLVKMKHSRYDVEKEVIKKKVSPEELR